VESELKGEKGKANAAGEKKGDGEKLLHSRRGKSPSGLGRGATDSPSSSTERKREGEKREKARRFGGLNRERLRAQKR